MAQTYRYDLNMLADTGEGKVLFGQGETSLCGYWEGEAYVLSLTQSYRAAFGMGERFNRVNQKGLTVETEVFEKFCNQGQVSYCPVPFFFTDGGVGLFVDTLTVVRFSFGDCIKAYIRKDSQGRLPQVYLFMGTPKEILGAFTDITGKPAAVPKWSLGPWMSANRWDTQEEAQKQLALAKRYGFPHTVMVLEAWSDEETFYRFCGEGKWQDPAAMVQRLAKEGVHLVLWQIPVLKNMQDGQPHPALEADWAYAQEHHLCIENKDGSPYRIPMDHWFGGSLLPDFSNPETVEWWFGKRKYLLDMGVDGFKTDGGEFVLTDDVVSADGLTGLELRNAYASRYVQAYSDFAGKGRVLFSRAGYTGQQRAPMQWAGDQMSTWEEFGHVLTAGLSLGLSGVPFWGFDIGGFAGALPEKELYERAVQAAAFAPVMQWHSEPVGGQFAEQFPGSGGINDRSPWNIGAFYQDEGLVERLRYWFLLRMNLLPYLYQQSLASADSGLPMMRHLALEYPEEEQALLAEDSFMLGDLLVAPVLEKGKEGRRVYLPKGGWNSLWPVSAQNEQGETAEKTRRLQGGQVWEVHCGRERIPVFLRDGGCIALHLDDSLRLGSDVGNRGDGYVRLCFVTAGAKGSYRFWDDLGNEILVYWKNGQAEAKTVMGQAACTVVPIEAVL